MTNFKPGDRVWVLMEIAPDYVPDVDVLSGGAVIETVIPGTSDPWTEAVESAIPDVPHLDRIARYLAEHPETVEALEEQMHQSFGLAGETASSKLATGFLRAMRGEGE